MREKTAADLFPYRDTSPEEYAARNACDWGCFSFDEVRYSDAALDAWIQRLGRILSTPGAVRHYQEALLTREELEAVLAREKGDF